MYTIMAIKVGPRNESATSVQEVLTKFGCIIQTRLGLHEANKNVCSNEGLILLNMLPTESEEINRLNNELEGISGVTTKIINM